MNRKHEYTSCKCELVKHGMSNSKIYSIYHNMKDRCYNANHHEFQNYGGKGIKIYDEWLGCDGFIQFLKWTYDSGYKQGLSIDRIDSSGDYHPNNCRWVTLSENTARANKDSQHRRANEGQYYGISPDGDRYEFDNANKFAKEMGLLAGCIRDVANQRKKTHKNWTFGFTKE